MRKAERAEAPGRDNAQGQGGNGVRFPVISPLPRAKQEVSRALRKSYARSKKIQGGNSVARGKYSTWEETEADAQSYGLS